jgi:hypothetical protein
MIKADGPAKVKETLLLNSAQHILAVVISLFILIAPAHAQVSEKDAQNLEEQEFGIEQGKKKKPKAAEEKSSEKPEDVQPEAEPEKIKPIEAEEFKVRIKRRSTSGRVLLLDDSSENRPRPGRILLLKNGNDDVAAVRVLKNFPGRFAAKIVLNFGPELKNTDEYRALKKIGEKIVAMIKEREQRGKDLDATKTDEDLAKEVAPDDNELDRGIPTPKPKKKGAKPVGDKPEGPSGPQEKLPEPLFTKEGKELDADSIEVKDEDEPYADLSVQEELPIELFRHAFSLEYGNAKNVDKNNNPASYSALGVRYAFNVWRMPMFKRKTFQDMFSLELSAFYYSISPFLATDDSVTVIPLIFTLRYNLLVGESLSFFTYLGFEKNNVSVGSSGASTTTGTGTVSSNTAILATTKAALGIGSMVKIGPAWAIRLDFGTDLFGLGAVLKF